MIQLYADGSLIYDSRMDDPVLLSLSVTTGIHIGGTAAFTLPHGCAAYDRFVPLRTIVEIYKNRHLVFRGRALHQADNFIRDRTITCEGERCFLQDGVLRPYVYQAAPDVIFRDVIAKYNDQVDAFKRFESGTVTVTDANNYLRMESESAESAADVLDKLLDRCGGYIVFTTNAVGQRVINWYKDLGYHSEQTITFGENLLNYSSSCTTDIFTRLIPYGYKDFDTGKRLTISGVNNDLDYIQDDDAVRRHGIIARAAYWDDVTDAHHLLQKAQAYLSDHASMVTSLMLTAVDLSALDTAIDTFEVGDLVHVHSAPHGVDADFLLVERTEDLLDPVGSTITLGMETTTLSGSSAAADRQQDHALHQAEQDIRRETQAATSTAIEATKKSLSTLIQQTGDAIRHEVSEQYTTNGEVDSMISTVMTQLKDSFEFKFTQLETTVDENDAAAREQLQTIEKYIRFENGDIVLGENTSKVILHIENDRISFLSDGAEIAYFSDNRLHVLSGHFVDKLRIGNFAFLPRQNGSLSLVKEVD